MVHATDAKIIHYFKNTVKTKKLPGMKDLKKLDNKDLLTVLMESLPFECPECGKDLTGTLRWDRIDQVIDEIARREKLNLTHTKADKLIAEIYRIGII